MFGYIGANWKELTEAQKARYQAAYCGVCRSIARGTTARSVSLSWGAREVGSPYEWRGGARHCSRAMVGESGLETC